MTLNQTIQTAKEPSHRELNMGNPFEHFAHYLVEGCIRNLVLTSEGTIFEATPNKVMSLHPETGYHERSREEIQRHGSYKLFIISALETHMYSALSRSQKVILEKDVDSPFLKLGEQK